MNGANAAAWAQAWISGAAIIVSGLIAVFVPWNERRIIRNREKDARLDIETTRSDSGGLEVLVSYTPEFHSHALGVSISLIAPIDARVYKGVIESVDLNSTTMMRAPTGLSQNVRYNAVSLLRYPGDPRGLHKGLLYIEWPDERVGPHRAMIDISILEHGNHLVYKRRVTISPIDDQYYGNGAPIAVIDYRRSR